MFVELFDNKAQVKYEAPILFNFCNMEAMKKKINCARLALAWCSASKAAEGHSEEMPQCDTSSAEPSITSDGLGWKKDDWQSGHGWQGKQWTSNGWRDDAWKDETCSWHEKQTSKVDQWGKGWTSYGNNKWQEDRKWQDVEAETKRNTTSCRYDVPDGGKARGHGLGVKSIKGKGGGKAGKSKDGGKARGHGLGLKSIKGKGGGKAGKSKGDGKMMGTEGKGKSKGKKGKRGSKSKAGGKGTGKKGKLQKAMASQNVERNPKRTPTANDAKNAYKKRAEGKYKFAHKCIKALKQRTNERFRTVCEKLGMALDDI